MPDAYADPCRLPDGRGIDEYIADARLDYLTGRALECLWMANHYIHLKASRCGCTPSLIRADLEARIRYLTPPKQEAK